VDVRNQPRCMLCRRPRAELRRLLIKPQWDPLTREMFASAVCDECVLTAAASLSYGPLFMVSDPALDRCRGGSNACPECLARDGEQCTATCAVDLAALDPMAAPLEVQP
jgi:hypothetical protein